MKDKRNTVLKGQISAAGNEKCSEVDMHSLNDQTNIYFFLFDRAYSAACLAAGILCQSVIQVQNSSINKRIMRKQVGHTATQWSDHFNNDSSLFQSICYENIVCCFSPMATFLQKHS